MALGEGLGRLFDLEAQISDGAGTVHPIGLPSNGGVTFLCSVPGGGGDTFVVKQCGQRTGGTFTPFNPITRYYTKATLDGTSQWVDSGDLASNLGTITIGSGSVAFYVGAGDMTAVATSTTGPYVEVVPGTSGIVVAVLHDLDVQRSPKYLRAPNS
jgi:hypothetical protein